MVLNGETKTQGRNHRKGKVNTETSVARGKKRKSVDVTTYLTDDTKVKNSVSPKEFSIRHLEESPVVENCITNTTRCENTAVGLDMEKHLETSNFVEKFKAHLTTGSRIPHGSEYTVSSSDSSHRAKSGCKEDHLSNSKNGVDIVIPLKRKKKQTLCGNQQLYDDILDMNEHHTRNKQDDDPSNSNESSDSIFLREKTPEHKLKKKKIAVTKQDSFGVTLLGKQLMKDTQSKNSNFNADSEISKNCDQPKIFESSTDSILYMKPKRVLRKKVSRAHQKNHFDSVIATCNNIEPVAEMENKSGYISSGSTSTIALPSEYRRHNFKRLFKNHGLCDSAVENLVEGPVQNMQPNVNDPCSSGQQSKESSADVDVMRAPARTIKKINKKRLMHDFFGSVVGKDNENVEEQTSDIVMTKNSAKNTLAANTKERIEMSKVELFARKVLLKDEYSAILPETLKLKLLGVQGSSHDSQILSDEEYNSSVNRFRLARGKYLVRERVAESTGDSLTTSRFRPKVTSSKIYLTKDGIAEQCPPTSPVVQQNILSNTLNITHNAKQSHKAIVWQPKSTDDKSNETNTNKRKKSYSVCDNSPPSSDLTFDPDNVPHSTMLHSSSKKKHQHPAMYEKGNKSRKTLFISSPDSPEMVKVSNESGENISVGKENAGIRIASDGRESEKELTIENEINDNGTQNIELQQNKRNSNTVEKEANFANNIYVPENLYAVSDHEPIVNKISANTSKMLNSKSSSKLCTSNNDVSQVFRHATLKTKSMTKSSSVNSQEELINGDSKKEMKQQGNYINAPGEFKNSSENIVFNEIIKPQSTGYATSKTHQNSYKTAEIEQIPPLDTLHQEMCNSEFEVNPRKSDRVNFTAERRKSSSYPFVAVSHSKLSGASHSPSAYLLKETPHKENFSSNIKNSNKSSTKESNKNSTVESVTNPRTVYSNSDDSSNANSDNRLDDYLQEGLKRLRQIENERGSYTDTQPHLTADGGVNGAPGNKSQVNTSFTENFSRSMESSRKSRSKESKIKPVISNISNDKITHSDSSDISNTGSDKRPYNYLKDSSHRNRQTDSGRQSNPDNQSQQILDNDKRGSYRDAQPHLTADGSVNSAPGEKSVISRMVREPSPHLVSASEVNTSLKENFSQSIENRHKRNKESNKKSVISNISNAKITHSDSSGLSNINNGKSLYDYSKDRLNRNRQTDNGRQSNPDNQSQQILDNDKRGSYRDAQPHLTADGSVNSAPGEKSVISRMVREPSPHLVSASEVNTSLKENFSQSIENSHKRNKESNKKSVISNISNAKITHSDSSGLSNINNGKSLYDYSKDRLNRNRQTDNGRQSNPDNQSQLRVDNDGTEGVRSVIIRQPTHQKKIDVKQTQPKPTARACFRIDGEQYQKPKLARPKRWINQRFCNHMLPKFSKKYGLESNLKYEEFVIKLCNEVTACIRNRKNWDKHVHEVQKLVSTYLSINTLVDFLMFADKYLPDTFVFKMGITYGKTT